MKSLAGMGVHRDMLTWLRTQEHDAKHLCKKGLQRLPDQAIFGKASAEQIDRLAAVLPGAIPALEQGAIVTIQESRHRIRHLPIGDPGDQPEPNC